MKIASRKNAKPSIANGRPITVAEPTHPRGHRIPNSNDRIVPDTAPTANSTPIAFAQRRASVV